MKKFISIIILIIIALPAFAQDKKQSLYIAYENSDYGYKEPALQYPPHWTGRMQGISAEYIRRSVMTDGDEVSQSDNSFFAVELRYMQGKVDYDGYLWDGTPARSENITDYYMEGALKAGYVYNFGESGFALWPYAGLGGRFLTDKLDEGGSGGYRRESTYIYIPVGFNLNKQMGGGFSLTLNAQGDILLSGRQISKIDGIDNVHNTQDEGYGLRASLRIQRDFGGFGIFAEPFYRYWHIQTSEPQYYTDGYYVYTLTEPKNETREAGIKIGIMF